MPNTADTLAWAYVNKGAFGLAVDLLQEATYASRPIQRITIIKASRIRRMRNNDPEHDRAQFERALQLNPSHPQLDQIRKALGEKAGG